MDGTRSASIYTSLKDDEFRLLSLIARGNDDGLIELKLSTHNLNTAPPYGKLSYIWGTHKADKTLRLNGHNVQVTSDLHAAIRHIWNSGEPELLFIDKLCINQKDLEEQNVQVRLLDRIIRNANRVHVWLGEEHESTQSAMQSLALFGASSLTLEDGIAAVAGGRISLADVRKLLSHPWFMRLWSAQEIGLARDIRVYQGISCIQWNSLIQGASGVAKLEESYSGQVLIPNWRTRRLLFHVKHS